MAGGIPWGFFPFVCPTAVAVGGGVGLVFRGAGGAHVHIGERSERCKGIGSDGGADPYRVCVQPLPFKGTVQLPDARLQPARP